LAIAKASRLTAILLTVVAVAAAGITLAAITANQNLPSSGTVTAGPNIGVYSNSACTNTVTSLNWGTIEAGGSTQQTIYIEDTGGAPMTLSITVTGWNPSTATNYITLTWTGQGQQIQPGANNALAVTLTLSVSPSITGITNFGNSITISGTG
jgi:hypothetical protein